MVASITVGSGVGVGAKPYLSTINFVGTNIDELVKKINSRIWKRDLEAIVCVLCSALCCFLAYSSVQSIREHWRVNQLKAMADNAARDNSQLVKDEVLKVDGYTCSACKMEPRAIVYGPCKHMMYCRECWEKKVDKEKCEKCQQPIKSTTRIYLN